MNTPPYIYTYTYTFDNIDIFCLHIFVHVLSSWFNLNFYIEANHYASIRYQFNSTTSKKNSCPKTQFRKILTETKQY